MATRRRIVAGLVVAAAASLSAVSPVLAGDNVGGGGSSFMANLQEVCRALYNANKTFNPNSDVISYTASSSGTGRSTFQKGQFDYAGSDAPYGSTETKPAGFVYVPLIGGPIGIAYRIDGISPAGAQINLPGEVVAKIFAGQITNWNDPAIAAANKKTSVAAKTSVTSNGVTVKATVKGTNVTFNATMTPAALKRFKGKKLVITPVTDGKPGTAVMNASVNAKLTKLALVSASTTYEVTVGTRGIGSIVPVAFTLGQDVTFPSTAITVAYRSGSSGTTDSFANYLNKEHGSIWTKATSGTFATAFPGTSLPVGTFQSYSGNDGVTNAVRDTNGAITYAEVSFITERKLSAAKINNTAGKYVAPSPETSAKNLAEAVVAADGLVTLNYRVTDGASYPINAVAYGIANTAASSKATAVKGYFSYILNECAPKYGPCAGYAPMTGALLTTALAQVAKVGAG
ncbi:MAG: substrate-binding domain-containing protein [Acidimicrobiales bacterium]